MQERAGWPPTSRAPPFHGLTCSAAAAAGAVTGGMTCGGNVKDMTRAGCCGRRRLEACLVAPGEERDAYWSGVLIGGRAEGFRGLLVTGCAGAVLHGRC